MLLIYYKLFNFRILTTPNEETWTGVTKLKDYKPTFPKWSDNVLKKSVKNLNTPGMDLLQVIIVNHFV